MPHLLRTAQPTLHQPVLVAAFEGWNDAGEAATFAARFLVERWDAKPFATIDPEEFFDFTSTRPHVQLDENDQREIVWPSTTLSSTSVPGADRARCRHAARGSQPRDGARRGAVRPLRFAPRPRVP